MICQPSLQQHPCNLRLQEHCQQDEANDRWNCVLEVVPSLRHEAPSLVLSVRTLSGFPGQHNANQSKAGIRKDCTEELRRPKCVWIVNRHEHTAEVVLATFHHHNPKCKN